MTIILIKEDTFRKIIMIKNQFPYSLYLEKFGLGIGASASQK
jgi:hypothetical protein